MSGKRGKGPDWEARYRDAPSALFGDAPNEYVREIVARSDFAAKSVLCLADGDGRNGRWLAQQGLDVSAVDLSSVAAEIARRKDAEAGVRVERMTGDLVDWQPSPGAAWDAAFLVYLQSDPETRRRAVATAVDHLRPGGWFVAEAFGVDPSRPQDPGYAMGPDHPGLRYTLDELSAWLPGFQMLEALAGTVHLKEGEKHRGDAFVVRVAARKSA